MPTFTYQALDDDGDQVNGDVDASSKQDAINKVHNMGYVPTDVSRAESGSSGSGSASASDATADDEGEEQQSLFSRLTMGGVSEKELTQFTSQLSTLIDAGLPIVRSLKVLSGQMSPSTLKTTVDQVADDVEQGSSLSEAMSKHPNTFNDLYTNMIKAGETGGVLDTILARLADYKEKAQRLKRKIVSASIYPAAVLSIAVLIVGAIMYFVIPKFRSIYTDMVDGGLPLPTWFLIKTSDFIAGGGWILAIAIPVLLIGGSRLMRSSPWGRYTIDSMKLHLPLVGDLFRKTVTARFCRTFGTLTSSGVPILEALNIVRGSIGNEVMKRAITEVHDSIREGENIAEPLNNTGVFDDIVVNMIDVGEETGELDRMLIKIADDYEEQVDTTVDGLMSILEPIMIIGMALIIGFIVIALFLPIVTIMEEI